MIKIGAREAGEVTLPLEVLRLFRREREIATIIYRRGPATALQVADQLRPKLSNSALRSMLNRLVVKGILRRTRLGLSFTYSAALTLPDSQRSALRQFARDYFDGSLERAAASVLSFYSEMAA